MLAPAFHGLVGLALLLGIFVALIRGPHIDGHDRHLAEVLAVIYLVGFLGDPYLRKQLPLVTFATVAGLVSAHGRSLFWNERGRERSDAISTD